MSPFTLSQSSLDVPGRSPASGRYLHRAIYVDGGYVPSRGLPRGCPLSPVLGAMCLRDVDDSVAGLGVVFVRFMDDWVVLAKSRWVLRRAVRRIREVVARLRLELAPDKTFVGRVSRGFDFCGYWFDGVRLGVSRAALSRFVERVHRLYEQGASDGRVGEYVGHWVRWVGSGLGEPVSTSLGRSGGRLMVTWRLMVT